MEHEHSPAMIDNIKVELTNVKLSKVTLNELEDTESTSSRFRASGMSTIIIYKIKIVMLQTIYLNSHVIYDLGLYFESNEFCSIGQTKLILAMVQRSSTNGNFWDIESNRGNVLEF
jgi:hypothetical protein